MCADDGGEYSGLLTPFLTQHGIYLIPPCQVLSITIIPILHTSETSLLLFFLLATIPSLSIRPRHHLTGTNPNHIEKP